MKNITFVLIILIFFGFIKKKNVTLSKKKETEVLLDTTSNGKFLKIYTTLDDNYSQSITAEYGTEKIRHKIDLLPVVKHHTHHLPFYTKVNWISEKSFAIVDGCGTECIFAIIFNIEKDKPYIQPILYYPNKANSDFKTDNPNLCIAPIAAYGNTPSFIIVDIDSQKKDTINLPNHWLRELNTIYNCVDQIKIEKSKIEITQNQDNGKIKKMQKEIILK